MSWWGIVLCVLGGLIVLLALVYFFLVVTVVPSYDGALSVAVKIGPFKILDVMKLASKKPKKPPKPQPPKPEKPLSEKLGDASEMAGRVADIIHAAEPGVKISKLKLHCTLGSSSPMAAALQYGAGWAAIGLLTGVVDNVFEIQERDLQVFSEYQDREMEINFKAVIKLHVRTVLKAVLKSGILKKDDENG